MGSGGGAGHLHGEQRRLAIGAGAEAQLGIGQVGQAGGSQQARPLDARGGGAGALGGDRLRFGERDGRQKPGGPGGGRGAGNLGAAEALTRQHGVVVVLESLGQALVAGAGGGEIVFPFGAPPQEIERGPGGEVSGIAAQVLAEQAAGIGVAVQIGVEGNLPMAEGGGRVGGKILVRRPIKREVIVRPVHQQIAIGRGNERPQAPGRFRILPAQALDGRHHLAIVGLAAGALAYVIEALGIGLRWGEVEAAEIGAGHLDAALEKIGFSNAHAGLVALQASHPIDQRPVLGARQGVFAKLQQAIGAAQHQAGKRRRIGVAHGIFERQQSGSGAGGGGAGGVLVVDALVGFRGMNQVVGGLVASGQRQVALGLRQLGVKLAHDARAFGGLGGFESAGFEQPGLGGERREPWCGMRGSEVVGNAGDIVRFDTRRRQIPGGVIGNLRELLNLSERGDGGGIVFVLVGHYAQRQLRERAADILGMRGGVGFDGRAPGGRGGLTPGANPRGEIRGRHSDGTPQAHTGQQARAA